MERSFIRGLLLGIGHFVGFIASAFFMAFLIGEGLPELLNQAAPRIVRLFIPMLLLSVSGYLTSIFRKSAGGLIMIAGGTLMALYHLFTTKSVAMAVIYGLPYLISGSAIYLAETRFTEQTNSISEN